MGEVEQNRRREPKVDWDEVNQQLIADFEETRAQAGANIVRLRRLLNAILSCEPMTKDGQVVPLSVKDILNDLKTVDRHIKHLDARRCQQGQKTDLANDGTNT